MVFHEIQQKKEKQATFFKVSEVVDDGFYVKNVGTVN